MDTVEMTQVDVILSAGKEAVGEPWLWRIGKQFDVSVNILKANVDIDNGWLLIRLKGSLEEVQRAITWLMTTGLHVDAQQRSVGS